jgi:hypothetical protein
MQQNPRNLTALLTNKINKTLHKQMSTKSEYYTLLHHHHLQSDDGSKALPTMLHEYLNKFKILQKENKSYCTTFRDQEVTTATKQSADQEVTRAAKQSADLISSFWIHININTSVSNKIVAIHLEEDIKQCF